MIKLLGLLTRKLHAASCKLQAFFAQSAARIMRPVTRIANPITRITQPETRPDSYRDSQITTHNSHLTYHPLPLYENDDAMQSAFTKVPADRPASFFLSAIARAKAGILRKHQTNHLMNETYMQPATNKKLRTHNSELITHNPKP